MGADNYRIDNHAALDTCFVFLEAREVPLTNDSTAKTSTIDAWYFFGCSVSAGKKNDHVFHNKCMDYVIKKDNENREILGKKKTVKK